MPVFKGFLPLNIYRPYCIYIFYFFFLLQITTNQSFCGGGGGGGAAGKSQKGFSKVTHRKRLFFGNR